MKRLHPVIVTLAAFSAGAFIACTDRAGTGDGSEAAGAAGEHDRGTRDAEGTIDVPAKPKSSARCRAAGSVDANVPRAHDASSDGASSVDASVGSDEEDAAAECEGGELDASAPPPPPPPPPDDAGAAAPSLRLEQSLYLDGCFLTNAQIDGDASFVYLASGCTPKLFIISRAAGHAVETLALPANADAVAVTSDTIHVSLATGSVIAFQKAPPHPSTTISLTTRYGQIAAVGGQLYASTYQSRLAVTSTRVFFSPLNSSERALEVAPATWATLDEYAPGTPGTTSAFDRSTKLSVAVVPNPLDSTGQALGGAMRADDAYLFLFKPGCCGMGAIVYDASSLGPIVQISFGAIDDMMRAGRWLFGGTEGGQVVSWDFQNPQAAALIDIADLRTLTGHTGIEDIEVRAIWVDANDRLLFAGSSWGNDQSRNASLPSAFVLAY